MKKFIALNLAIVIFFCNYTVLFATELQELADHIFSGSSSEDVTNEFEQPMIIGDRFSQIAAKYTKDTELSGEIKADEMVWTIIHFKGETVLDAWRKSGLVCSFSDFVNSGEGKSALDKIRMQQENFKRNIGQNHADYEYGYSYSLTSNGLAVKIPYGDIEKLTSMVEVDHIRLVQYYSAPVSAQSTGLSSSKAGTATNVSLSDGYNGEGMLVSILDTGLDVNHPAFNGDHIDTERMKVSVADVNSILSSTDAYFFYYYSGNNDFLYADAETIGNKMNVYYGNKIVFAYDYGNNDTFVTPTAGYLSSLDHGTHTTGTIAGYETDHEGNVVFSGVLPNAQIAFMKVFEETYDGIFTNDASIAAAIEDSIMLNADAINISLGSACGFSSSEREDNYIAILTKYASEVGISVQVAAGNGFNAAYAGAASDYPLATNPDYGSVNAPASYGYNLAVGSYDGASEINSRQYLDFDGNKVFFESAKPFEDFVEAVGEGKYDWIYITGGNYSDFKDAEGKICLVQTNSEVSQAVQYVNAYRNHAKAVIFVDSVYRLIPASDNNVLYSDLPYCIISLENGEIATDCMKKVAGKVTFAKKQYATDLMSVFSAWGCTGGLTLKPEITAVGGNVYSTLISEGTYSVYSEAARKNFNMDYGYLSGTSMAAPSVTGYIVKLRQALKETGITDPGELSKRAATLLMCTATTLTDINGNLYSPRYQGAGAADIEAALKTRVYLDVIGQEKPKAELGDDPNKTGIYPVHFRIVNQSNSSFSYKIDVTTMTDALLGDGKYISLKSRILNDCHCDIFVSGANYDRNSGIITVGENSVASVLVKISISDECKSYLDKNFVNGSYVEGFVKLIAQESSSCDLSLPYLAFYGDWDVAPMMDASAYGETEATVFASYARGLNNMGYVRVLGYYPYSVPEGYEDKGFDPNLVSITGSNSGNGGGNAIYRLHSLCFGLLRNAAVVEYSIVDTNTGEVYATYTDTEIVRAAYTESGGYIYPAIQNLSFGYGMPNNTEVTVYVTAKLGYDSDEQNTETTWSFNVYVDDEAPRLYSNNGEKNISNGITYDKELDKYILTLNVYDNHCLSCIWLMTYGENGFEDALDAPIPVDTSCFKARELNRIEIDVTPYMHILSKSEILGVILEDGSKIQSGYTLPILVDYKQPARDENGKIPALALEADDNVSIAVGYASDLGVKAYPAEASYSLISDNPSVAYIDQENNLVVGRSEGKAKITVSSGNVSITRDIYVYQISGEWRYEIITENTTNYMNKVVTPENMGKLMITAYIGDGTHIEIPKTISVYDQNTDSYSDIEVAVLGPYSFAGAYLIKYVKIPNTVNYIAWYAFENCVSMEHIEFEENSTLNQIDTFAFDYCRSLKNVTVPASVEVIGSHAFAECLSLSEVKFEHGSRLTFIDSAAFTDTIIEEISLPEGIEELGSGVFSGCENLKEFTAPSTLTGIGSNAFAYCYALETVDLSAAKIEYLGTSVFRFDKSLYSVVGALDHVNKVPSGCFEGCTELVYVELHDGIQSIDYGAFDGCYKLLQIYLGDSMTSIDKYAFRDCYSLRTVVVSEGANLKVPFGEDAFLNCFSLEKITVDPANPNFMSDEYGILYVKDTVNSTVTGTKPMTYWTLAMVPQALQIKEFHLRSDVSSIAPYAFSYHTELEKFFIPADSALLTIGDYAFAYCTGLDYIDLQNAKSLTGFGSYCFALCVSLTNITLPCTSIPNYGFYYCYNLKNINIPSNFYGVGVGGCAYCIRLEGFNGKQGIILPSSACLLADNAFYQCRTLKYVDLSACKGMKHNGWTVFGYCTGLDTVKLNTESTEVGREYFFCCSSLKNVNLQDMKDLKVVRMAAFYACTSLESVIMPPYLEWIETSAFEGCLSLKNVVLPCTSYYKDYYEKNGWHGNSFELYQAVFKSCDSLKEIELPWSLKELPAYTFAESGLTSITVPGNIGRNNLNTGAFYLAVNLQEIKIDYKRNLQTGAYLTDENGDYIENEYYESIDGVLASKLYQVLSSSGKVMYEYPPELLVYPCSRPAEVYIIPEQFTEIPKEFFMLASGTEKVIIPSTVTSIGDTAFYYSEVSEIEFASDSPVDFDLYGSYGQFMYSAALKKVTLPDNMTTVPQGMFYSCTALEEVNLGNIKNFGYSAFMGCEKLKEADLSSAVVIEEAAFEYCESLKELHFSSCLTSVEFNSGSAFEGCKSLERITVDPGCRYFMAKDNVLYSKAGTILYLYPAKKSGATFTVPNEVTKIAECAFAYNEYLETIILPKTLQSIGFAAFYQTEKLSVYVFRSPVAPVIESLYGTYCSFYDRITNAFGIYLTLVRPKGATSYDNQWTYSEVFDLISDLGETVTVLDRETGEKHSMEIRLSSNEIPVSFVDYTQYLPETETKPEGGVDYLSLLSQYLNKLLEVYPACKDDFSVLEADFAEELKQFERVIDERTAELLYIRYVKWAEATAEGFSSLYSMKWSYIHKLIAYASYLTNTYAYQSYTASEDDIDVNITDVAQIDFLGHVQDIAYSGLTVISYCTSSEEIEYYYDVYKTILDTIPKADDVDYFWQIRSEALKEITDMTEKIVRNENLYSENAKEYALNELANSISSARNAYSYYMLFDARMSAEKLVENLVKKSEEQAFNQYKSTLKLKLDAFREEDYLYSDWYNIQKYIEEQKEKVDQCYTYQEVYRIITDSVTKIESCRTILDDEKQSAIDGLYQAILFYNMKNTVSEDVWKSIKNILSLAENAINSVTVTGVCDCIADGYFDTIWQIYSYHHNGYTSYRNALDILERYQETASVSQLQLIEETRQKLSNISFKVSANGVEIEALMHDFESEYRKISKKANALGDEV